MAFPRRGGFIASIKKAREIEPEMLGSSVRVAWVRNVSPFGLGWFRDYRDIWELEINNKIIISFDDLSTHAREYFPTMKLTFFISLVVAAIALAILFNLNRKRDPA